MADTEQTIDVTSHINTHGIGGFQLTVVALCALTVFLDGYDTQSIAFVAPALSAEWHIPRAALGPIFSAGLVGLLVGALLFGPVADKIGRRWVIMICTAIFGVCTLMTATSTTQSELLLFRVLAGLGFGGAMPNAIAMTAEYCPEHRRATLVMIMFTGFSLGAAAGGAVAAALIPHFGWRSVWYLGGILPLCLLPILYVALPESIRFLVLARAANERIKSLMRRIDPSLVIPAGARFVISEPPAPGVPVLHLFREGRAGGTVLLWIMFFTNLLALFFVQNWVPVIVNSAGISEQTAVIIGTLLQVGGVVAALFVGMPIDRFGGYAVMPILYGLGCVFVIALGQAGTSVPLLMLLSFGAGFCVVGGQNSANAMAAIFYPTAMRSTGVGWCLGIGRIGAIIGPLIGALLVSLHWPNSWIFLLGGIPLACAAVAIVIMGRLYTGRGTTT